MRSGTNWWASFSTAGLAPGTYTVYAVATDATGIKTVTGLTAAGITLVVTAA